MESFGGFCLVIFIFIALICPWAAGMQSFFTVNSFGKMIDKCEQNLPRTQHCKLIAVVDTK